MPDCIVFDLDGTISDPAQGITASLNYALAHHGYKEVPAAELLRHIGPPLDEAFTQLALTSDERLIASLVAKYRERYSREGYAENRLYNGMVPLLEKLSATGQKLGVCTSKRVDFAERILQHFNILQHFHFVDGGDTGIKKGQQLAGLLKRGVISPKTIMVGDRGVDLSAAHQNGLTSIGVLWGYGSREELLRESPRHIFQTPAELLRHLS